MTAKQFYDWQTADVMRLVDCLERSEIPVVRDRRSGG